MAASRVGLRRALHRTELARRHEPALEQALVAPPVRARPRQCHLALSDRRRPLFFPRALRHRPTRNRQQSRQRRGQPISGGMVVTPRSSAFRVGAVAFVLVGVPRVALAQVQDDAALADLPPDAPADAPDEKPSPLRSSAPSTKAASSPGSDDRSTTPNDPEADLEPPTPTAELRRAYPDLQVRVTPP